MVIEAQASVKLVSIVTATIDRCLEYRDNIAVEGVRRLDNILLTRSLTSEADFWRRSICWVSCVSLAFDCSLCFDRSAETFWKENEIQKINHC